MSCPPLIFIALQLKQPGPVDQRERWPRLGGAGSAARSQYCRTRGPRRAFVPSASEASSGRGCPTKQSPDYHQRMSDTYGESLVIQNSLPPFLPFIYFFSVQNP